MEPPKQTGPALPQDPSLADELRRLAGEPRLLEAEARAFRDIGYTLRANFDERETLGVRVPHDPAETVLSYLMRIFDAIKQHNAAGSEAGP